MNERIKAVEIKKDFEDEFQKTLKQLKETYPRVSRVKKDATLTEDVFTIATYTILLNMLKQIQIDSSLLSISEFHSKYVPNLPILYRDDFSTDEFKEIIESSYLKERDKKIAYKYFIEKKSHDNVYKEIDEIGNIKTVYNNINPINDTLLDRACDFNNEHTKLKEN